VQVTGTFVTMARAEVRRMRWDILAMGIVVGLAGAFTLTALNGARRAATSWDRFVAATDSPDIFVEAPSLSAGVEALATARATPEVEAATGFHWLPLAVMGPNAGARETGIEVPSLPSVFVVMDDEFGRTIYRPNVLAGRLADQSRPEEIIVNRRLAELDGVDVGDRPAAMVLGPTFEPAVAIDQELVVVGVVEGPIDVGPLSGVPAAYFTAAFRDEWLSEVMASNSEIDEGIGVPVLLKVAPGADARAVARAVADASPPGTTARGDELAPSVDATISYVVWGFAALAGVAAIVTIVVGAQAMQRLIQPRRTEEQVWAALGTTSRQRSAVLAVAPVLAAALATVVASVGAILASPLVPTGFPRQIEMDPGIWVDVPTWVAGTVLVGCALATTGILLAGRARRAVGRTTVTASPPWLRAGSPARSLGVRAAIGVGTSVPARRRARAAIAATAVGVLGISAVSVVASSTRVMLDSPRAWGFGFDRYLGLGDSYSHAGDAASAEEILANPAIAGISEVRTGVGSVDGSVDGSIIELQQIEPRRGAALPVLLDGRAPISPDEVVLGPLTMRDHGLTIGETVTVSDNGAPMRIVGTAAIPALEHGEFGFVAWVSTDAFARLEVDPFGHYMYLAAAPGVRELELDEIGGLSPPVEPSSVTNFRQVGAVPAILAAFLGVVVLASLAHALLVAVRGRDRELAILRSLGFVRHQVRSTVTWQSLAIVAVGLIVGVPAGLVVGAWTWRRIASTMGTPLDVSVPAVTMLATVAAAVVAAGVAAIAPAHRSAQLRAVDVLRIE
jgi:FtsX-like permease family